jgi:hypothetical protein
MDWRLKEGFVHEGYRRAAGFMRFVVGVVTRNRKMHFEGLKKLGILLGCSKISFVFPKNFYSLPMMFGSNLKG